MPNYSTLVDFLLARIAEDEAAARKVQQADIGGGGFGAWIVVGMDDPTGVDYDPTRVLAECESKRTIVELHQMMAAAAALRRPGTMMAHYTAGNAAVRLPVLSAVLQVLALPYADHPDYQQEWKP